MHGQGKAPVPWVSGACRLTTFILGLARGRPKTFPLLHREGGAGRAEKNKPCVLKTHGEKGN